MYTIVYNSCIHFNCIQLFTIGIQFNSIYIQYNSIQYVYNTIQFNSIQHTCMQHMHTSRWCHTWRRPQEGFGCSDLFFYLTHFEKMSLTEPRARLAAKDPVIPLFLTLPLPNAVGLQAYSHSHLAPQWGWNPNSSPHTCSASPLTH